MEHMVLPENPIGHIDERLGWNPFIHLSLRKDVYPGHHVHGTDEHHPNEIADDLNINAIANVIEQDGAEEGAFSSASLDREALKSEDVTTGQVPFPITKRALAGRRLGYDYSKLNGFSMYGGRTIPGFPDVKFPALPSDCTLIHIVLEGTVDFAEESTGLRARLGKNDVLWRYIDKGRSRTWSEMYPPLASTLNPIEVVTVAFLCRGRPARLQANDDIMWRECVEGAVKCENGITGITLLNGKKGDSDLPIKLQRIAIDPSCETSLSNGTGSALAILRPTEALITVDGFALPQRSSGCAFSVGHNQTLLVKNTSSRHPASLILVSLVGNYLWPDKDSNYMASVNALKQAEEITERQAPELGPYAGDKWTYTEAGVNEAKLVFGLEEERFFQSRTGRKVPARLERASEITTHQS